LSLGSWTTAQILPPKAEETSTTETLSLYSLLAETYRGIIRTLLITPSPDILRLRLESLHDLQGVATKKETPTINVPSRSAGDSIKNK
jgi:hypothetical protein